MSKRYQRHFILKRQKILSKVNSVKPQPRKTHSVVSNWAKIPYSPHLNVKSIRIKNKFSTQNQWKVNSFLSVKGFVRSVWFSLAVACQHYVERFLKIILSIQLFLSGFFILFLSILRWMKSGNSGTWTCINYNCCAMNVASKWTSYQLALLWL